MSKHIKNTFSLILVICLVLSGLPSGSLVVANASEAPTMDSIASDTGTQLAEPELSIITDVEQGSNAIIIQEDVSRRAEYEKHFLMSDGSYQVALYNEPVHQMENGEWVEIDNTLALQMAADGTAQYVTANGLSDIRFAQSFDEQLVTMQQDGHAVSWGIQAVSNHLSMDTSAELVQPVRGELIPSELSTLSVEQQKTLATKASSAIQYRNALRQNVDLEYIVLPTRVKENIILQSAQDISYYVVTVYTENLSARLLENREIEFYNDSDKVIFTMTSPYMYDNAGELSEDITVEMVSKGNGCYFIKMTPNAQWLSSESRVYPVVIDPQVSVDTTRSNIIDNYVLKDAGVQNRNLDRMYIGNRPEGLTRAFIQYAQMPTLPEGSTILAATMSLTLTNGTDTAEAVAAYTVTSGEWASGTIEWANMPEADIELESNISHNNLTGYTFSCLSAVQTWYNGDTTGQNANYGIMIRYQNETAADYNAVYSADYTDESKRPVLTLTYAEPIVHMNEGETFALSAPELTGTITWTSSDTEVATVDTSGVVTGIKAGVTTVTASVDGKVHKVYTVYVTIPDGVYRISQGSLYLGTSVSIKNHTEAHLVAKSEDEVAQLGQLWKIKYITNGYYTIRPMHKLNMALDSTSGTVDIVSDGGNDALVGGSYSNRWGISYQSGGYVLQSANSDLAAMRCTAVYPGADVLTDTYSATNSVFHWTLSRITNPPSGVLLYDTSTGYVVTDLTGYISPGDSRSIFELGIVATVYSGSSIDQTVYWQVAASADTSVANVNRNTGTVTGLSPGRTTIEMYRTIGGVTYTASYSIVCAYYFNIEVCYDHAYLSRFPDARERLTQQINELQALYFDEFGMWITYSTPYLFSSYADEHCYSEPNSPCDHGTCSNSAESDYGTSRLKQYHHKNLINISLRLSYPDIHNALKIAYVGHNICYIDDGEHKYNFPDATTPSGIAGVSFPYLGLATITDASTYSSERMTSAHEQGHYFWAEDHYGGKYLSTEEMIMKTGDSGFSSNCIYGENRREPEVMENIVICDGCKAIIQKAAVAFSE